MRTVKVTLNEQTVQVTELRRRDNQAWRERLETEFKTLADAIEGAGDLELTGASMAGLVRAVAGKVVGSVDIIAELLAAYAPELATLMDDAYDSEIMEAFTQVLGLAYPFGSMLEKLRGIGAAMPPTSPNSR